MQLSFNAMKCRKKNEKQITVAWVTLVNKMLNIYSADIRTHLFLSLEYFSKVKCTKDTNTTCAVLFELRTLAVFWAARNFFKWIPSSWCCSSCSVVKKVFSHPIRDSCHLPPFFFFYPPPPPQHPIHTNSCTVSQTNSLLSVPSARLLHLHPPRPPL